MPFLPKNNNTMGALKIICEHVWQASKEDGQKVHPSRVDDLENLVLKTKAELRQKEEENVALLKQVQQCEKKWSLFEVKLKSMEEMYQTQIDTLKVSILSYL